MKKRILLTIILMVIVTVTILSIDHISPTSDDLQTKTAKMEGENETFVTITSYVDEHGTVVMANDKGYASVRKTKDEDGQVILEEYLDEFNSLVTLPAGYSAIKREYKEDLNTTIIYLDEMKKPVLTNNGYDMIHRTYNKNQLADVDTYYASGIQVTRKQGYAQYCRTYDDQNRLVMIEYRDQGGSLVNNTSGYARRIRTFNEQNKISEERYYSADGRAAILSLGQSGYTRQYDEQGRTIETIYTGPDGMPINTRKGYSKVTTIYNNDGSTIIRYYDVDGNPVTGGNSNYGLLSVSGQKVYLDEDGEVIQRLDNILNTRPYLVLIIGVILTVTAILLKGHSRWIFLFLYIGFILYMTMAYREQQGSRNRLELFYTYRRILSNADLRQQIVNNIWLFIPFGTALSSVVSNRFTPAVAAVISIFICLCASISIEAVQYIAGIGLCEADDVVSNTIGGIIGVTFSVLWRKTGKKRAAVNT